MWSLPLAGSTLARILGMQIDLSQQKQVRSKSGGPILVDVWADTGRIRAQTSTEFGQVVPISTQNGQVGPELVKTLSTPVKLGQVSAHISEVVTNLGHLWPESVTFETVLAKLGSTSTNVGQNSARHSHHIGWHQPELGPFTQTPRPPLPPPPPRHHHQQRASPLPQPSSPPRSRGPKPDPPCASTGCEGQQLALMPTPAVSRTPTAARPTAARASAATPPPLPPVIDPLSLEVWIPGLPPGLAALSWLECADTLRGETRGLDAGRVIVPPSLSQNLSWRVGCIEIAPSLFNSTDVRRTSPQIGPCRDSSGAVEVGATSVGVTLPFGRSQATRGRHLTDFRSPLRAGGRVR